MDVKMEVNDCAAAWAAKFEFVGVFSSYVDKPFDLAINNYTMELKLNVELESVFELTNFLIVGDLATITAFAMKNHDFARRDDKGRLAMHYAVEGGHSKLLPVLNIQGCQTNSSKAFAVLKADGSVVSWGDSWWGGDCSKVQDQITVDVQSIYSTTSAFAALKADGSVLSQH